MQQSSTSLMGHSALSHLFLPLGLSSTLAPRHMAYLGSGAVSING